MKLPLWHVLQLLHQLGTIPLSIHKKSPYGYIDAMGRYIDFRFEKVVKAKCMIKVIEYL
jgi:hypothetical protein